VLEAATQARCGASHRPRALGFESSNTIDVSVRPPRTRINALPFGYKLPPSRDPRGDGVVLGFDSDVPPVPTRNTTPSGGRFDNWRDIGARTQVLVNLGRRHRCPNYKYALSASVLCRLCLR
jgi:hypothetical protein